MYGNANIDSMSLYDALVLAHEIEYKWHKLKNSKPYLEKSFLEILTPIFEKYKDVLLDGCMTWVFSHSHITVPYRYTIGEKIKNTPVFDMECIIKAWYEWYIDNLKDPTLPVFFKHIVKYGLKNPIELREEFNRNYGIFKDDYRKVMEYINEYVESIPSNIINKIKKDYQNKIHHQPFIDEFLSLNPSAAIYNGETDETFRDMIKTKDILLSPATLNIDEIMRRITLSLNVQHLGGNIISDYVKPDFNKISDDQLKKLSHLPTHKWDKELEQEFGPEVLQGYRSFGK